MDHFPKRFGSMIFSGVLPDLLPEIDMRQLVLLGAMVRKKKRIQLYTPLIDGLRKIQWVKLCGIKAISIEQDIHNQMKPNVLIMHPIGLINHSLNITDCLIHTKSALDSFAIFLTSVIGLKIKREKRDFRFSIFQNQIKEKDGKLWEKIQSFIPWINLLQKMRNEWIHRSTYLSTLVYDSPTIGILPIPKEIKPSSEAFNFPLNKDNFWSTQEFVNYHYKNLINLFKQIIERSYIIEFSLFKSRNELPLEPSKIEDKLFHFPFVLTKKRNIKKVMIKTPDYIYLGIKKISNTE